MSETSSPESALIPYLTVDRAREAIEWYRQVFGAATIAGEVIEMDDGRIGHASLLIGGQRLYLSDEFPEMNVVSPRNRGGTTVALVIHVPDADATFQTAVDGGATAQQAVENRHGARSGWFIDPWGHRWSPTSAAR